MSKTFVVVIDGQILRKSSQKDLLVAVLQKSSAGWKFRSCHETWEAAEVAEKKAISEMELGQAQSIAIVGMRPE